MSEATPNLPSGAGGIVASGIDLDWLAAHDREVAARAWDEGARHVYTEGGKCSFARDGDPCPYNPYREGQGDDSH